MRLPVCVRLQIDFHDQFLPLLKHDEVEFQKYFQKLIFGGKVNHSPNKMLDPRIICLLARLSNTILPASCENKGSVERKKNNISAIVFKS